MSEWIVSISAVLVAGSALYGLRAWQRELTGRARHGAALAVIRNALRVRETFEYARGMMTSSGESTERVHEESEPTGMTRVLDEWYARAQRIERLRLDLVPLVEAGWEVEAVFEDEPSARVKAAVAELRAAYGDLSSAAQAYFEGRRDEATGASPADKDWLRSLHLTVYARKDDELSNQVEAAVNDLMDTLKGRPRPARRRWVGWLRPWTYRPRL